MTNLGPRPCLALAALALLVAPASAQDGLVDLKERIHAAIEGQDWETARRLRAEFDQLLAAVGRPDEEPVEPSAAGAPGEPGDPGAAGAPGEVAGDLESILEKLDLPDEDRERLENLLSSFDGEMIDSILDGAADLESAVQVLRALADLQAELADPASADWATVGRSLLDLADGGFALLPEDAQEALLSKVPSLGGLDPVQLADGVEKLRTSIEDFADGNIVTGAEELVGAIADIYEGLPERWRKKILGEMADTVGDRLGTAGTVLSLVSKSIEAHEILEGWSDMSDVDRLDAISRLARTLGPDAIEGMVTAIAGPTAGELAGEAAGVYAEWVGKSLDEVESAQRAIDAAFDFDQKTESQIRERTIGTLTALGHSEEEARKFAVIYAPTMLAGSSVRAHDGYDDAVRDYRNGDQGPEATARFAARVHGYLVAREDVRDRLGQRFGGRALRDPAIIWQRGGDDFANKFQLSRVRAQAEFLQGIASDRSNSPEVRQYAQDHLGDVLRVALSRSETRSFAERMLEELPPRR